MTSWRAHRSTAGSPSSALDRHPSRKTWVFLRCAWRCTLSRALSQTRASRCETSPALSGTTWTLTSETALATNLGIPKVPYNLVLVQLDEGPRMLGNLLDCSNEAITEGLLVEVVFERVTDEVTLPRFRPAR